MEIVITIHFSLVMIWNHPIETTIKNLEILEFQEEVYRLCLPTVFSPGEFLGNMFWPPEFWSSRIYPSTLGWWVPKR